MNSAVLEKREYEDKDSMITTYPEIIRELIQKAESRELTMLRYSSVEQAVEDIDRSMHFFAAYVAMESLDEDVYRDEEFVTKHTREICSIVEEKARFYWFRNSKEHFRRIDERMEALKKSPEYSHIKEWEIEARVALKDRVLVELNQEIYPKMIEILKQEYQQVYKDEWEEHWKQVNLFEERIEYEYTRKRTMPPPFNYWDERNFWRQFYFARDRNGNFYYQRGASGSSDQRACHGIYGHLFAIINEEKPVPTYFFTYDSRNRFMFTRKEESLWLQFVDLTTNFAMKPKESDKVLEHVYKIEPYW